MVNPFWIAASEIGRVAFRHRIDILAGSRVKEKVGVNTRMHPKCPSKAIEIICHVPEKGDSQDRRTLRRNLSWLAGQSLQVGRGRGSLPKS